jgi:uncharacterized protein (DUF849 family)
MDKIIVNFAPTGLIPRKKDNPYVPIAPSEIIQDVKRACKLGITMVHLHARNSETEDPTYKKEIYAEIISGIRNFAPDLIICVSTSGRVNNDYKSRSEVLALDGELKPDMASLTLSSLNFNKRASINEPEAITSLAKEMADKGIIPELEIFDLGMANYANYLLQKGILKQPLYANIILGNIACAQPDLIHIGCLIRDLPSGTMISLGGVGRTQLTVNSLAVSIGYGVRIGLEDNLWFDKNRTKLATNMELIERIKNIADANGREFMTPVELRNLLGLKQVKT